MGLDAVAMASAPYTIVVDGAGAVSERKLANHEGGAALSSSARLKSSGVVSGVRTVVLTRPLAGKTAQHYSFNGSTTALPFITAVGKTSAFGYHKAKTASALSLHSIGMPDCVCDHPAPFGKTKGTIEYYGPTNYTLYPGRATQSLGFNKNCVAEPHADLLHQRNPTCDLHTYAGGLSCCHHLWLLTDRAQEDSFSPEIFEYHIKFRFYYQAYTPAVAATRTPASHQGMVRLYHQTEDAASEYDIPQCDRNTTALADCVHQITAHWQVKDMLSPQRTAPILGATAAEPGKNNSMLAGLKIMFAGGHCHAPACLSIELYNADTGHLLCRQLPAYGTTDHLTPADPYDENGCDSTPQSPHEPPPCALVRGALIRSPLIRGWFAGALRPSPAAVPLGRAGVWAGAGAAPDVGHEPHLDQAQQQHLRPLRRDGLVANARLRHQLTGPRAAWVWRRL